jgi:hypothetical protein
LGRAKDLSAPLWPENEVKDVVNINEGKESKTKKVASAKNNSGRVKITNK